MRFDRQRPARIGLEETVFAQSKAPAHIARLIEEAEAEGRTLFITRLTPEALSALPARVQQLLDYDEISRTAVLGALPVARNPVRVALVTAGTSDLRVATEARRTLAYAGEASHLVADVGVAGLWRLLEHVEMLRRFPVCLVFAGMDAALPSVVGGLVPGSVIAVPTSVGYGVAEGGRVALDSALASCAPGVTVVNIDNGYGAACAALRQLNMLALVARQSARTGAGEADESLESLG